MIMEKEEGVMRKKNRIIVIDDDLFYLDQLKMILTNNDYDVMAVAHAGDGMALLRSFRPDVLLLDWELPNVSGIDFLRTIRSSVHDHDLYVIMLSGRIMTEDIVTAISSGADDYVIKPFSSDELLARIDHGVRNGRERRAHTIEKEKMLEVMRKLDAFISQFPSVTLLDERSLHMLTEVKHLITDMETTLRLPVED